MNLRGGIEMNTYTYKNILQLSEIDPQHIRIYIKKERLKMKKKADQPQDNQIQLQGKITKDEGKHRTEIHYSTKKIEIFRTTSKDLR